MMRLAAAALACAAFLPAQTKPVTPCADLRGLTNNEVSIAIALPVEATPNSPAHCRVSGQILPQVGFELHLPPEWNGRFVMYGNGGFAGESLDSGARNAQYGRALRRGYAVAATDTGHSNVTEPGGTFAADRQKLLDYAFRSLHVTAEASKMLLRAYYGAAPAKSYFEGCSTGGRQALILAQRFPNDFDGITVGAPVLDFSGTMVQFVQGAQANKVAPLIPAKMPALAAKIYESCDAKDGLKDGIIDDPRRCDFQPARDLPRCDVGADKPDCFTAGQIATLEAFYKEVKSQGKKVFPMWPVGAETAGQGGRSGWDPWKVNDGSPTLDQQYAEGFLRYLAPAKPDPQYDILQFNFDRDLPRLENIRRILDATDTDLTRFRQHGGKLLMYFGWADPALNPMMGVEYYEAVTERMGGGTRDFFRLFMAPGMFHCGDGPGPNAFDTLTPLSDWVEHAKVPNSLIASKLQGGAVVRTRPLCPYPQVAKYNGTGSIDDAANFVCK
jgi:feruloyl esterase